ncbi:hypothetical protein [Schleiferia thermophila]|jgi:hypothetical protein|uniref:hypothetical protein n=1 Tax=Schleiferia thermophila TaxID=884107 RepID=UPI0004E685E1|nr:hypothetical protein [Schleiferia thermophila]KFD39843.1 hypothetical protein AT05_03785 [Schleiferia thermophila str. Yellowstone]
MNRIDQLFREKLQNHQLKPAEKSKEIFLRKATKKPTRYSILLVRIAAACAVLLTTALVFKAVFTRSQSPLTSDYSDFVISEFNSDSDTSAPVTSSPTNRPHTLQTKPSSTLSNISTQKQSFTRPNDAGVLEEAPSRQPEDTTALVALEPTILEAATQDPAPVIPETVSEIYVISSGLFEQINHYSTRHLKQRNIAIRIPVINQKFQFHSPLIDEVEQTFTTVKREILDFNLADASRNLTHQFSERFQSNQSKNQ